MKNIILLILAFVIASFAKDSCKELYQEFVEFIPDQVTVDCSLSDNNYGFFFEFKDKSQAVLVYDYYQNVELHSGNFSIDMVGMELCKGSYFNKSYMTSKQIASMLFKYKNCEEGFSASIGKSFTSNKGTITDSHDGKKYKTVQIGTQIWMAENLSYKAKGSMCPNNNPSNCAKYGRLYDWDMAKRSCPTGWHLPKKDEIETLINLLGGKRAAREILKARASKICDDFDCGTDDFGFTVLPAGAFFADQEEFSYFEHRPYFWTADAETNDFTSASFWDLLIGDENFFPGKKDDGYSVRCLKDELSASNIYEDKPKKNEIITSSQKGTMTDSRDGQQYKTVTIGSQTWMAENMRYKTANSVCYGMNQSNCTRYGRYYTSKEADTVCPNGWHLPSGDEFRILLQSIGGDSTAGSKLRATGWEQCGGNDDYGFAALPTGLMLNEYEFFDTWRIAYFRSSSYEGYDNYVLTISCLENVRLDLEKSYAAPVRCIKDR